MDVLLFALNIAWKVLALIMGWSLFTYVVRNGSGTFKEFLDTVGVVIRTAGHWIRVQCLSYLKKESENKKSETMSQEEFEKKMSNGETFTL